MLVRHIEGRRRSLTSDVLHALLPLAQHLPPAAPETEVTASPDSPLAPALPPGNPSPDALNLSVRRRTCLQQAARLRTQHARLTAQAITAHRWAEALPALLAAAAPPALADDAALARAKWLADWLTRRARPLSAEAVTRWHRLGARIAGLEAEAAALA
jgi:hypothetical protein